MFRKPSECTSDTETVSDRLEESSNYGHDSQIIQNTVQSLSSTTPVLEPFQHLTIHYLSYIRKECRESAVKALNSLRDSDNQLSENHPDVDMLSEKLYQDVVEQMRRNGVPLPDFSYQTEELLRNNYSKNFGAALFNAANVALGIVDDPGRTNLNVLPFSENSVGQSGRDMLLKAINYHPGSTVSVYSKEYQELRLLGEGGYGKVFHVRNPIDGQDYAIKQIAISPSKMEKLNKEGLVDTVLNENRTAAALSHPNVVRYHDSWVETLAIEHSSQRDSSPSYPDETGFSKKQGLIANNDSGFTGSDVFERSPGHENMPEFSGSDVFERSSANKSIPDLKRLITLDESSKPSSRLAATDEESSYDSDDEDEDEDEDKDEDKDEESEAGEEVGDVGIVKRDVALFDFTKTAVTSGVTIFIKMAYHELTLKDFLLQGENNASPYHECYCFHTAPAAKMCLAILGGVEYLHSKNIVHRDLKPANVLLSIDKSKPPFKSSSFVDMAACQQCKESGNRNKEPLYVTPHICDFGLAAKLDELDMVDGKDSKALVKGKNNKPVGTKHYRPANMPTSEPIICPKLDMYSLGVIAFELIMKFETASERARVLEDLSNGIFPRDFDDYDMADGIKNMLCEDRDQRWGAKETREWLEGLLGKKNSEVERSSP